MIDGAAIRDEAVRGHLLAWLESYGRIRPKVGGLQKPKANYLQKKVNAVIEWCKATGRPVRIIILKPRQKGSSTISVGSLYHSLSVDSQRGFICGGEHQHANNLFKILKTYADNDEYFSAKCPCTVQGGPGGHLARWANGSEVGQGTASNPNAGVSGTYQFFLATEVALWAEEGVADAEEVLANALKTVPHAVGTTVILESTARGASGAFYSRWIEAIEFDDAKRTGDKDSYIRVFAPWFEFEDSVMGFDDEAVRDEFVSSMTPDEADYMREWKLTPGHMKWRRWAIKEECGGDENLFDRDYPTTWETAFQKSGMRRFNAGGLKKLRTGMMANPPKFGALAFADDRERQVIWTPFPDPYGATVWLYEHPRPGFSYLFSADTMTGAQATGDDPDHHGPLLIRAGCFDMGKWCPPAVVARLASMHGKDPVCRWDIDVLGNEVFKLSKYYGDCLIVPEENNDRGLIEYLKMKGANIIRRPVFNRVDNEPKMVYGWKTTVETRGHVVEAVAKAVREIGVDGSGIECWDEWLIGEMENAVTKQNGKVEAADGWHDDQWFSLGIGLCSITGATLYSAPQRGRRGWFEDERETVTTAGQWS